MPGHRAPFTIDRLDHVLVIVNGMAESLHFYGDVLGCDVESRLPDYGMVELRAGSSHLDLVDTAVPQGAWARPAVAGGRNVDHVALRLGRVDERALRDHLAEHGIAIAEERIEDDGTLSLYVRDPSGNTIELISG
ncbi:MAG TPA: VOC family protein [Candidatus Binatia bacterium]|nr:VOC family protein [Candidatus Binatia bacterium]